MNSTQTSYATGGVGPMPVPVEKLIGIAQLIGIDPVAEPQYLWLAEQASQEKCPEEWKVLKPHSFRV